MYKGRQKNDFLSDRNNYVCTIITEITNIYIIIELLHMTSAKTGGAKTSEVLGNWVTSRVGLTQVLCSIIQCHTRYT